MSKLLPPVTGMLVSATLILSACQAATPAPTTAALPTVIIPTPFPAATSAPQHPAARADAVRLDFSSNTMSSSPGDLQPASALQVVFKGEAGRKISIKTIVESDARIALSVWGTDGTILVPEIAGITQWEGVLPAAQDYYLNLHNASQKPLTYQLIIKMPPLSAPSARRIQFQPNTTGGTTQGELPAKDRQRFVLGAAAGQSMTVKLTTSSDEIDAFLYIWSADGTVYTLTAPVKDWSGRLPATQDYYIELVSASDTPLAYQLSISIPPSIPTLEPAPTDQPGFKIATDKAIRQMEESLDSEIKGTVISGERDRYTFSAMKGETLDVVINSLEHNAAFTVIAPDNNALPGTEEGRDATKSNNTISTDGNYAILVGPTRGNATYTLRVKINETPGQ